MKIAIISDTHNDTLTLQNTLNIFRESRIHTICHCGDLTSPEMIKLFDGFQVFLGFGNCDYQTGEIKEQLILLGTESNSSYLCQFTLQEISMAITHGHSRNVMDLAHTRKYRYIFTGHTHLKKDTNVNGCRIINPGSLSTRGRNFATYATLELDSNQIEFHKVNH